MRRPLAATLIDLVDGVTGPRRPGLGLRGLELDLPIEVELVSRAGRLDFLADLPRWRWTTDFDPLRGRLQLSLQESGE